MNTGKYIKSVYFKGLWGIIDLHWELNPHVNILSGSNGSGKSTLLRSLADMFRLGGISPERKSLIGSIEIELSTGEVLSSEKHFDPKDYNVSVISSFDLPSDFDEHILQDQANNIRDISMSRLQNSYLQYHRELSKEIDAAISEGKPQEYIEQLSANKIKYYDIIDSLFASSGKKIDRENDNLNFAIGDIEIPAHTLSSGEKQALIILTNVLIQKCRPYIMLIDEPEVSLHFDWQKRIIEDIMALNPALQLLLATHSPAMIMKGWVDCVKEISDIIVNCDQEDD